MIRAYFALMLLLCTPFVAWGEENLPNLTRKRYFTLNSTTLHQGKDVYSGLNVTLLSPRSFRGITPYLEGAFATSGGIYLSDNDRVKNMYLHKDVRFGVGARFNSRFGVHAFSMGKMDFEGKTKLPDDFNVMTGKKSGLYVTSNQWFNLYGDLHLAVFAQYVGGIERKMLYLSPQYKFTYFTKYQPMLGVEWSYSQDIGGKMQRVGVNFAGPPSRFAQSKFSLGLGSDGKGKAKPYYSVAVWRQF